MQRHSQALEEGGSGGEARPPAMSAVQRRIAVGMLVGLLAFVGTLKRYGDLSFVPDWIDLDGLWIGLYSTPLGFVATWLALSPRPLAKRLSAALGLGAIVALGQAWGSCLTSPGTPALKSPAMWVLAALVSVVVVFGVTGIWLRRYGWRITLGHEAAAPPDQGRQFTLRQMCAWMAGMAVILALARCMSPHQRIALPDPGVMLNSLIVGIWVQVVASLLGLPLMVPCVGLVLAEHGKRGFVLWVAAMTVAVGGLVFSAMLLLALLDRPVDIVDLSRRVASFAGSFELGLLAVALGGLGVLRACGYRLIRLRRRAAQGMAQPEASRRAQALRVAALRRRWWESPFPYVVVAMAGLIGVLGWPAWQFEAQRRKYALERLEWEDAGADCSFVNGEGVWLDFPPRQPLSAAALTKLSEPSAAETVVRLGLAGARVTDEQMACLSGLRSLNHLDLADTEITDATLEHLRGLSGLKVLCLRRTGVSDNGMKVVAELKGLRELDLNGTRITDAGLDPLRGLSGLKCLLLEWTQVTDKGIDVLGELKGLTMLSLRQPFGARIGPLTDRGVAKVREALPQCQVIDAGAWLP
jgi:hypothetical protein